MLNEKDHKKGLTWATIVPWFIAVVSLTFFVADRLNAPARESAALTGEIREMRVDINWLKDNMTELRTDFKRHTEAEK